MSTDLSDEAILEHLHTALRALGEGRASIPAAGEWFIRKVIGLSHEMIPGACDPFRKLSDDAE